MADFHIPTIAIIGGESLVGREIRELLSALKPSPEVRLITGEADSAKMVRDDGGDPILLAPLNENAFEDVDAVFLAGTAESAATAMELAEDGGPPLIDIAGSLEDHPRARLRAPQLEESRVRPADTVGVIAHPAAVALAMFFKRVSAEFRIERSVVEVFEPASERGQAGLTELQTQTINLLSFKPQPKEVYDAQVGFNLLPEFGKESPNNLEALEARIDRHLATLLLISSSAPMPSLRLIQAPVFHGYSCSIWIEFADPPEIDLLEEAIASAQIEVRRADEEAPHNVGVAGQSGLTVGGIRKDRNDPRACWLWLVVDNLRMTAETAVAVAREHL